MKSKLTALGCWLFIAVRSWAASVDFVDVAASEINCAFSTNCTLVVSNTLSPLTLPGTSGTGNLHTRVFVGDPGSAGAGVYGYEYRIDLTGVTATNSTGCFTNSVRCFTNRVEISTNVVTCQTNSVGVSNLLSCVTNIVAATNFTVCLTNVLSDTNVITCLTNDAGVITCFTNSFTGSNGMICMTNFIPAQTNIVCTTNSNGGSNGVVCTTNMVHYFTNMVVCTTNQVPCPGEAPCIATLRILFGPVYTNLNFGTGGLAAVQAYVVTSGDEGTIAPVAAEQVGNEIRLEFAPPICPGESSYFIGLFSTNRPGDVRASLGLTSDSNLVVVARAPTGGGGTPGNCDLAELRMAIEDLQNCDIVGPNNRTRAARRTALLDMVEAASEAVEQGELANAIEAVHALAKKATGGKKRWLTSAAVRRLEPILDSLLRCLEEDLGNGDDDDKDHCDNDGSHNGNGDGEDQGDDDDNDNDHGNGNGNGKGHGNGNGGVNQGQGNDGDNHGHQGKDQGKKDKPGNQGKGKGNGKGPKGK